LLTQTGGEPMVAAVSGGYDRDSVIWMSYLSCTQQERAQCLIHRHNFTEI